MRTVLAFVLGFVGVLTLALPIVPLSLPPETCAFAGALPACADAAARGRVQSGSGAGSGTGSGPREPPAAAGGEPRTPGRLGEPVPGPPDDGPGDGRGSAAARVAGTDRTAAATAGPAPRPPPRSDQWERLALRFRSRRSAEGLARELGSALETRVRVVREGPGRYGVAVAWRDPEARERIRGRLERLLPVLVPEP